MAVGMSYLPPGFEDSQAKLGYKHLCGSTAGSFLRAAGTSWETTSAVKRSIITTV